MTVYYCVNWNKKVLSDENGVVFPWLHLQVEVERPSVQVRFLLSAPLFTGQF